MHQAAPADAGKPLKILQFSDCHLSRDPAMRYRNVDADAALEALVPVMAAWRPDLVLATGDLSEDGSALSYQRLSRHVGHIGAPVYALPGNHDDAPMMRKYFHRGPWNGPLSVFAGSWQLVLLDSTSPGRIDGVIAPEAIRCLRQELKQRAGLPLLLALHHQPVPVGSPWIDRYMLEAPEILLDLIAGNGRVRAVIWGHVHQAFDARLGNATLLACPSTAANSLAGATSFRHDPAGGTFRSGRPTRRPLVAPAPRGNDRYRGAASRMKPAMPWLPAWKNQPQDQIDQDPGKSRRQYGHQNIGYTRTGNGPAKMLGNAGADSADHCMFGGTVDSAAFIHSDAPG